MISECAVHALPMTGRWPGSLASNKLGDEKESTLPASGCVVQGGQAMEGSALMSHRDGRVSRDFASVSLFSSRL